MVGTKPLRDTRFANARLDPVGVGLLRAELDRPALTPIAAALARQLLLCLLLRLARVAVRPDDAASAPRMLLRRLQAELDAAVASRPSVAALPQRLRVSASTLNRACRQLSGRPAKALVDRRVALEAQRLLVHTDATAAAIGERLGFSEATNFLKFFRRLVGTTPDGFRRRQWAKR